MEENKSVEEILEEDRTYTEEEVYDIVQEAIPNVELDTEECDGIKLDTKEFTKGVKEVSNICGRFSALLSVGFSKESAVDLILNQDNIAFNKFVTLENCKTNKETAKIQNVNIQSQQI